MFFTVSGGNMVLLHGFVKKTRTNARQRAEARGATNEGAQPPWLTGNPHVGSTLESLLREDGTYEDAKDHAIKSVLAYKLEQAMKAQNLSKAKMAERMETSRSQLDRLLDPENEGVTLHTLKRAAAAVGMRVEVELRQP